MPGIVHIGVGAFHRAHQAMYVHRLGDPAWSICGVGMLPGDALVRDGLRAQDGVYSLVLKHPDGRLEREEITSITDYLLATDDPWTIVDRLADPSTRIVSMTITEGGYRVDDVTGEFDLDAVADDLVPGAAPSSVFAVVCHGLDRRRAAGSAPFTILSCDNIEANGQVARTAFTAFAEAWDPLLARWMDAHVSFPSCMVDRITPATTDADRALVRDRFGVVDRVPVVAEPFTQWVIEDNFTDGRPSLDDVGVQFVADVRPYELMKLRLLNASHQAMAYFGLLLGHGYAHEAAADADVVALLRRYMDEEATPTLAELPGVDLLLYKATLLERFANPSIADTLVRLAAFASDRLPKFLLPVVRHNVATGGPTALSAAVLASWLRWLEVQAEAGLTGAVVDRWWHGQTPAEVLASEELLGDLVAATSFLEQVHGTLADLRSLSPRAALISALA